MRTVYVVRHGLSQANNRENIGTPAFGAADAPLMARGIEDARKAGELLMGHYALDTLTSVATSTLLRTRQTALEAGFSTTTQYSQLDEIAPDLPLDLLASEHEKWRRGELSEEIIWHAETTLAFAPPEQAWFTHGLRIAGICRYLEQHQDKPVIPKFGEVRKLQIDD